MAAGAWTGPATVVHAADPLPSWSDGAAKASILQFVEKVGAEGSPDFVPVAERIAVFDHDGTLWAEKPMAFQAFRARPGEGPGPAASRVADGLEKTLDEGRARGWTVVDMKTEWKRVFPFENE